LHKQIEHYWYYLELSLNLILLFPSLLHSWKKIKDSKKERIDSDLGRCRRATTARGWRAPTVMIVDAMHTSSEDPVATCMPEAGGGRSKATHVGNWGGRGRGKKSGMEGPGRQVTGEDLQSVAAVPIEDRVAAETHVTRRGDRLT
jgi:hypothetical protein